MAVRGECGVPPRGISVTVYGEYRVAAVTSASWSLSVGEGLAGVGRVTERGDLDAVVGEDTPAAPRLGARRSRRRGCGATGSPA